MSEAPDVQEAPPWPAGDPSLAWIPEGRLRTAALWIPRLFWVFPLALYTATASPTVGWVDAALIARRVVDVKTSLWVNSHNLFFVLGRVWLLLCPVDAPAHSLNLLCAVLGAVTVFVLFRTGLLLTHNLLASVLGGVALTLGHSLWWHATMLEVYTLNTALIATMLWLLVRFDRTRAPRELYLALLCMGLGVSNHLLMGLFVFAFLALFALRQLRGVLWRPRVMLTGLGVVLLGAQIWLYEFVDEYAADLSEATEATWRDETLAVRAEVLGTTLDGATGAKFKNKMFPDTMPTSRVWRWRANYGFTLLLNYPTPLLLLAPVGWWAWWRRRDRRPSLVFFTVGIGVQALWSSNYMIWDMYAFGLPVWVLVGLLLMVGADAVLRWGPRWRRAVLVLVPTLLIGPFLHHQVPRWAEQPGFWQRYFDQLSYVDNLWDPAAYFANPNKRGYRGVSDVMQTYLAMPHGAHLWDSDGKGQFPFGLYYQKTLGLRRDVTVHGIWAPRLTGEGARDEARRIAELARGGTAVFVSSPYRPERRILDELYLLGAPDRPRDEVRSLSVDALEATFPDFELRRVPVIEGQPFFIYQVVPR